MAHIASASLPSSSRPLPRSPPYQPPPPPIRRPSVAFILLPPHPQAPASLSPCRRLLHIGAQTLTSPPADLPHTPPQIATATDSSRSGTAAIIALPPSSPSRWPLLAPLRSSFPLPPPPAKP
ncbi:hypothetical protein DAI22_05g173500 [Oryza sativa Japonica Group]|nr:hypothetical protein DAI22_05g173500 [Oryza sativa Japonica Group]